MLYIKNATIYTPDQVIANGAVLVEDGIIVAVGLASDLPCCTEAEQIDAAGLILAPGFIDLQINGAFGDDFTADPATIWRVAEGLPRYGVTAFLPTIITSPLEQVAAGQRIVTEGEPAGFRGARPLGLHVEGPFLNPQKKGAHNPKYLRLPSVEAVAGWSPETGVRLVTLAPELPWALEVIVALSDRGVLVSEGHSMATYDQAVAGFDAGMRYGTHLFNAMPALGHRDPGLPGALLTDERATVGFIADGVHTHPSMIKLVWQALGGATAEPGDRCDGCARHAAWGASAGRLRSHGGRHQRPPGRRHAGRQHPVAGSGAAQPDRRGRLHPGRGAADHHHDPGQSHRPRRPARPDRAGLHRRPGAADARFARPIRRSSKARWCLLGVRDQGLGTRD